MKTEKLTVAQAAIRFLKNQYVEREGMAKIDNNLPENHEFYNSKGSHKSLPLHFFMERYIESYYQEMKEFVNVIQEGGTLSVSGYDGLMSVAIGLAAKKSVMEKRPVTIDEILSE